MKKFFLFFDSLLIVCFSFYLIISYNNDKNIQTEGTIIAQNVDDDLVLLNDYKNKDIIYFNEIPYYYEFISQAIIKNYELPYFSNYIRTGDIYLKNQVIENFSIPYNLRVIEILENTILVENLDETFVEFSFLPKFKIKKYSNFSFSIKHLGAIIETENYEFDFNKDSGLYNVTLKILNNGIILNSSTIRINLTYHEEQEGLFIDKSYVYQDNDGDFINKAINIRGVSYYKKVYINILKEYDGYYEISGEVNGNNVIIKL